MAGLTLRNIHAAPGEKVHGRVGVGEWPDSSPIEMPVTLINGAHDGAAVLLLACMHGDEVVGTETLRQVVSTIDPTTMSGTVIACYAVNVPAFVMGTRVNGLEDPAGSNDLKRQLRSGSADGSLTDRLAAVVRDELVPLAEYYVDLHSSARGSTNSPRAIVAGDSLDASADLRNKLDELADACNFEFVFRPQARAWKGMYFAPSYPLEEDYGKAGLVLETGHAPTSEGAEVLVDGILNILRRLSVLDGESARTVPLREMARLIAVRANRGGIWLPKVGLGAEVKEGEVLGQIVSVTNDVLEDVIAPAAGVCIKVATSTTIWTGVRTHVLAVPAE